MKTKPDKKSPGGFQQGPLSLPLIQLPPVSGPEVEPPKQDFFDALLMGLTGPTDNDLALSDPSKLSARNQRRANAGSMAQQAANNPGAGFMGIPSGGGGSSLESVANLIGLISGFGK